MNKEKFQDTQRKLHQALNLLGNAYLSSIESGNNKLQEIVLNSIDALNEHWHESCVLHNKLFNKVQ